MIRSGLLRAASALASDMVAFALPQRCPGCGAAADPRRLLCDQCLAQVPRLSFSLCARCLAAGQEPVGCVRHQRHTVWPAWVYDERATLVVHALKYGQRPLLARFLAGEMARALPADFRADLVLEVPLHPARERERGYNQASLLADALSDALGVPRLEHALERLRPTRPQARLDPRARRDNVARAFRVRRAGSRDDVFGSSMTF